MIHVSHLMAMFVAVVTCFMSCVSEEKGRQQAESPAAGYNEVPAFSSDSAYRYVAEQCAFGPRVPGSEAHALCAGYFVSHFQRHGADTVIVQSGEQRIYSGDTKPLVNIIASYGLDKPQRILVCSHWDSRPFADAEPLSELRSQPIVGANDGASGCGVIMELARLLSVVESPVGVDFILFDLEDWGAPEWEQSLLSDGGWALGSAYWAENPHVESYKAQYGILLDMVGAPGAQFYREYISDRYAPSVIDLVWQKAADMGLSSVFVNRQGGAVTDDHVNVIRAGIPCIDIIQHTPSAESGFFEFWHTSSDNINCIDANTLGAVGSVLWSVVMK